MLLTDCGQAVHTKLTRAVMNEAKSTIKCAAPERLDGMRFPGSISRSCLSRLLAGCISVAGEMRTIYSA
jgi:hypothetical protein